MKAIGIGVRPRKNGNVDTFGQNRMDRAKEAGYQITKYNLNEMKYSDARRAITARVMITASLMMMS